MKGGEQTFRVMISLTARPAVRTPPGSALLQPGSNQTLREEELRAELFILCPYLRVLWKLFFVLREIHNVPPCQICFKAWRHIMFFV